MKRWIPLTSLALLLLLPACSRRNRDVGMDPGAYAWTTLQGDVRRAGTEGDPVPADPAVAWTVEVGRGLRSQPLVHRGVVLIAGSNRLLAAYSAVSGERFWEQRLNGSISGGILWRNDTLWVATESLDGEVSARRLGKGGDFWQREIGPASLAPLLDGPRLFVATDDGSLTALRAETGDRLWRTRLPGGVGSTPVPWGGHIVVVGARDTAYLVGADDGEIGTRVALDAAASGLPALRDDLMVLPLRGGELAGVDLELGEVLWRSPVGTDVLAAPVIAEDGAIYVLNAHGEVWRVPPHERHATRIAALGGAARESLTLVRDGLLVGRLDGTLYLLDRSGDVLWERSLGGSIHAPVAVADGAIFVPLLDGRLSKLE